MKTNEELFEEWWLRPSVKSPYGIGDGLYSPASLAMTRRKEAAKRAFDFACEIKDKIINQKIEINKSEALLNTSLHRENEILCGEIKTYRKMFEDQKEQLYRAEIVLDKIVDVYVKNKDFFILGDEVHTILCEHRNYLKQLEQG